MRSNRITFRALLVISVVAICGLRFGLFVYQGEGDYAQAAQAAQAATVEEVGSVEFITGTANAVPGDITVWHGFTPGTAIANEPEVEAGAEWAVSREPTETRADFPEPMAGEAESIECDAGSLIATSDADHFDASFDCVPTQLTFTGDSQEVLRIWYDEDSGEIKFEGSLDEGGEAFIRHLAATWSVDIKKRDTNAVVAANPPNS